MTPFVHLHTHTEYSLLDGIIRIEDYVKRCVEFGMTACAITDHGNMHGVVQFVDVCHTHHIKPIIGCEVYVAPGSRHNKTASQDTQVKDSGYHLVLLAKNENGYRNLCKVVSKAYTEGFYYKPRVDVELLKEYHQDLICLSGCLGGELSKSLVEGNTEAAYALATQYKEIFADDYYIEVQNHGLEDQIAILPELRQMAKTLDIRCVATNDAHYLRQEDSDLQDTMICIGTHATKTQVGRMRFSSDQFYLKSGDEMATLFSESELATSIEIAAKVDPILLHRNPVLPRIAGVDDVDTRLTTLVHDAFEVRTASLKELWASDSLKHSETEYRTRLDFELDVIKRMGFPSYILLVHGFTQYAHQNNIPVGPGRGSVVGSLVCWSLGITDVDPMQYDLCFERFLNPERVSMPDIDMDFCKNGRKRVIQHVTDTYGRDFVANIATVNRLHGKSAISDIARVEGISYTLAKTLSSKIPTKRGVTMSVQEAITQVDDLQKIYTENWEAKGLLDKAIQIEGLVRGVGVHAAGVIISPQETSSMCPVFVDKDKAVVAQYTMADVEKVGLVKMDFLGLETLTQIAKTQEFIATRHGQTCVVPRLWACDDKETFKLFSAGDTDGVFQFESEGMKRILRQMRPTRFEDLIALNALYRPGPLDAKMDQSFINRCHGDEAIEYLFPEIQPILEPTYGIILYQEQIMQIANVICGFSLGEADLLRRAIGKKDEKKLKQEQARFVDMAVRRGFDAPKVSELWDLIVFFAGYGFNKSHSAAYARLAYETAYLKAHYRIEFIAGLLSTKSKDTEDVVRYTRNSGIKMLGPDINQSNLDFSIVDDNTLRFGLSAIKGVGSASMEALCQKRDNVGQFTTPKHAVCSVSKKHVGSKGWVTLAQCGAFDSLQPNRQQMIHDLPGIRHKEESHGAPSLFALEKLALCETRVADMSLSERLACEKEILGMFVSGHPLDVFTSVCANKGFSNIASIRKQLVDDEPPALVTLPVLVNKVHSGVSARGNNWMSVGIEDLTGDGVMLLFHTQKTDIVGSFKHLMVVGQTLLITAKIASDTLADPGQMKLILQDAKRLEDVKATQYSNAIINVSADTLDVAIQILAAYPGDVQVYLDYTTQQEVARVKTQLTIAKNPYMEAQLTDAGCSVSWLTE